MVFINFFKYILNNKLEVIITRRWQHLSVQTKGYFPSFFSSEALSLMTAIPD